MFASIKLLSPLAKTLASKAGKRPQLGNRMWMPHMPLVLLDAQNATLDTPAQATFRVLPKMTKHEVKEYLTKIYGLPVVKVRTQNYMGKRIRVMGKTHIAYGKRPDYKKAFVSFDNTLADTGMGANIPGITDKTE